MTDLKKIAAEMRESQIFNKGSLHKWADALDAYAAAHEPVAWRYKTKGIGDWWHPISTKHGWLNGTRHEIEPLYAAPPLPSVSREKLREALHAQQKVHEFYSLREVSNALRALGINVTEDGK